MSVQQVTLKISPQPSLKVSKDTITPHQPLADKTPVAVLGAGRNPEFTESGIQAANTTCFGPRGGAVVDNRGCLWVSDTGHHRLLGWKTTPTTDQTPADWVIGQPSFEHEGRNAKGEVTASSLNVPTGIGICGHGIAVADAWNHRVLIWKEVPKNNNVAADIVLGQRDFSGNEGNQGQSSVSANSFHWPYGVAWIEEHLCVADSENRRVLIWKGIPQKNNQPADIVLGQKDFTTRDENAGDGPNAMSMRWPHGIAMWAGHFCVSDAGNNRIMVWKGIPKFNGAECDYILGQINTDIVDHNQSLYWPRDNTLNMPYAITTTGDWLIAADTANSRLLAWHIDDLANGASARALLGQVNFNEKGDNRWQPACADSLCWPYGIQIYNDYLVIADSGNNRISIWRLAL